MHLEVSILTTPYSGGCSLTSRSRLVTDGVTAALPSPCAYNATRTLKSSHPMRFSLITRHTMSSSSRYPISALPLPLASQLLIHALTPDEAAPSVAAFRTLRQEKPSSQRRARLLAVQSHFSYTAPYPQPFPFEIAPPEPPAVVEDKAAYVEQWLAAREAVHPGKDAQTTDNGLRILYPEHRDQPRELIGLSETGWKDCLPHLDVGDALRSLGEPTLSREFEDDEDQVEGSPAEVNARTQLVDLLSGHATLMSSDSAEVQFAPWSLRYSGHQFGSWAGQLGDGRAISVGTFLAVICA